jgi:hypothetical protein
MDYLLLLLVPVCLLAGYFGQTLKNNAIQRRVYSLECDVADVQTKILTEVKRRAVSESRKGKSLENEIIAKAAETPTAQQMWWMPQVPRG